jgi:O-acetyl-ADP-ribose deacetylase (regulator of RNase III)/uncharacterized protein YwgA
MAVRVLIGNLFDSKAQTLVNTVNCVGFMGKGVALEFKKRFSEMFQDYVSRCAGGQVKLGEPYLYKDLYGTSIINFPTKDHWRAVSRIQDIRNGLDILIQNYKKWGITSVAFPPLGCGNGGLEWDAVGPLMYQKLSLLDIPVGIYAPYGTAPEKLTQSFLSKSAANVPDKARSYQKLKLKPEWLVLLEMVRNLQNQPYAKSVGRIIFQKLCYTATEMGLNTGFQFRQGSYGPFSPQIREALTVLANNNLIYETQLGSMTALRIGSEYETIRDKYADVLNKSEYRKMIEKVTDLFMRIKSTEQAEEVSTVLYTIRQLKQKSNRNSISEQDVYNYIIDWKKTWNTESKRAGIASAIRNLGMLRWIKTEYSESLPVKDQAF